MGDELAVDERHPSTYDARDYVVGLGLEKMMMYLGAFSSCAIEDNRMAGLCADTLRRILDKEPVGERYILALAWEIKKMEGGDDE